MTKIVSVLLLTVLFAIIWLVTGCDTVRIKERVTYSEDNASVVGAKVIHWNEEFQGTTYTNENGEWEMVVPPDTFVNLCIENPRNNNRKSCFDGYLLTPLQDGELIVIEK